MQISVIHGFNAQTGRRYDATRFTTNDGRIQYPHSARRWYTATVVAHDEDHAFHVVLERGPAGAGAGDSGDVGDDALDAANGDDDSDDSDDDSDDGDDSGRAEADEVGAVASTPGPKKRTAGTPPDPEASPRPKRGRYPAAGASARARSG